MPIGMALFLKSEEWPPGNKTDLQKTSVGPSQKRTGAHAASAFIIFNNLIESVHTVNLNPFF